MQSNDLNTTKPANTPSANHQPNNQYDGKPNNHQNHIVIIGAGLAGWSVVDAIRAKDKEIGITLITADTADRYHKPMLSTAISQNKTRKQLIRNTGTEAAATLGITLMTHTWVTAIDAKGHRLSLLNQASSQSNLSKRSQKHDEKHDEKHHTTLAYDKLVIATGASVALPPNFAKFDKDIQQNLWHVNHLDCFDGLQTALSQGTSHIAIIGAGMVGCEMAEDLNNAGHHVNLIDTHPAPLASLLPPMATTRLADALRKSGITLWLGQQVSNITQANDNNLAYQLTLIPFDSHTSDTTKMVSLQVDHVIVSTGLKVDSQFIASSGLEYHPRTGIVVNETTLQTSMADIYAIGDCMSIGGVACRYVAPLRMQATTIADDILGNEHAGYQHKSPMIRLKNKSISIIATGTPNGKGHWQSVSDDMDGLKLEQIDNNQNVVATATIK